MRVLVIGCGSIGSRRARLLAEMGHTVTGVDPVAGRCVGFPGGVFLGLDGGLAHGPYDAAFVCTPADTHLEVARQCVEAGIRTFIEKPLCTTWGALAGFGRLAAAYPDVPVGVACNLRYAYDLAADLFEEPVLLWSRKPLKDWRPGAVGAYLANGIVLESAIHEIDFAVSVKGPIMEASALVDRDRAVLSFIHERGSSVIDVDWSSDTDTCRGALLNNGVVAAPDLSDEMYRREMAAFLDGPPANPLADALHTTAWALRLQAQRRS